MVYFRNEGGVTYVLSIPLREWFPPPDPPDHPVGRVDDIYIYNPLTGLYDAVTDYLHPGADLSSISNGYWVQCNGDITWCYIWPIYFDGYTWQLGGITSWPVPKEISAGWHMIGSVMDEGGGCEPTDFSDPNDDPDRIILPYIYWYNPEVKSYQLVSEIYPFRGYWILSLDDGTLSLP